MDLKISKKENSKWISRWVNNVSSHEIKNDVIISKDFNNEETQTKFDPSTEWITEVKYFNIFKPE